MRLTPEQAAACDAWSKDGTEENWVQLARVRAGIYGFDSELLAERILDLLDLLQQAEQDRVTLAAACKALMWPACPSADEVALLVAMCAGNAERHAGAMESVTRLRAAQDNALAALDSLARSKGGG